jgi:hypothetical protein
MKKMMLILAMTLIAATSYNQTSRKPANTKPAASKEKENPARTSSATISRSTTETRSVNNNRSQQNNNVNRPENTREATTRPSGDRINRTELNTSNVNTSSHPVVNRTPRYTSPNNTQQQTTTVRTERTERQGAVVYNSPRVYRDNHVIHHQYTTPPPSREYRAYHYVYRIPVNFEVYWTPYIHSHFITIYPMVPYWYYYTGYRIEMISAYDAIYYQGEVMTVYGRISEVYYCRETDEYFIYFGPYYPYQDFTVVMLGYLARRYSSHPERFFTDQYMAVTGLITSFNGEPEIVAKESFQIHIY